MKRLVTSDWQLADNPRDRYRTDFVISELPKLVEKYQPDQLLVLGDLTEAKDNHPASLVNEMVEFFASVSKQVKDVIVLQGNHDFLHAGYPFFQFLHLLDNVQWVHVPTIMDNCLYLPHTRNYKQDWIKDRGIDFKGHDFIFAHNIFEGVKSNGQALSGIPTSIFPDDAFVVAGDVHEPQTVDCVTYVGSPCLCDFGDSYQPRVLLLDDLKAKSIKATGKQKRLVEIFFKEEGTNFRRTGDFNPGDIVKVKAHLEMKDVAHWDNLRAHIEKWGAENKIELNAIVPIVAYVQGERAKLIKSQRRSDLDYVNAHVARTGMDEATATVGKEIVDLI